MIKKQKIGIWGSCISRELFNYTDDYELGLYLFQNPIHTLPYGGVPVHPDEIEGTSNFAKRMVYIEFSKQAEAFLCQNTDCDYIIVDFCDCRLNWFELREDPTVKLAASISTKRTIQKLWKEDQFIEKSVASLRLEDWKKFVLHFCDILEKYYPAEKIILHKFEFAEYYLENKKLCKFDNSSKYRIFGNITSEVEKLFEDRMDKCIVLDAFRNPIGNPFHHLGKSPMHFLDEIYKVQVEKLGGLLL